MKPDLQELIISDGEFRKHADIQISLRTIGAIILISFFLSILFAFGIFVPLGYSQNVMNLMWAIFLVCMVLVAGIIEQVFEKWEFRTAFDIKKQVDNHNQIIENLHTLDQLQEIGNPVKINDRGAVIEALKITREGLVRALQTDRILRENPKFKPEYFNIDLSTLEAEKTTVKAIEYAQLLDDAVQIGVSVQKEMRKLQGKR
jgi:hypothetical protein